jgi:hypothetical protein
VPLCPLQTPNAARTRTRTAAVGNQRLTFGHSKQIYIYTYVSSSELFPR